MVTVNIFGVRGREGINSAAAVYPSNIEILPEGGCSHSEHTTVVLFQDRKHILPTGYGIRQAVIALRRQDAATVIVYVAKGVDADGADQTCHRTGCH